MNEHIKLFFLENMDEKMAVAGMAIALTWITVKAYKKKNKASDNNKDIQRLVSEVAAQNKIKEPVPIGNDNYPFPFLWDEIKIPIQYGSNYYKAFAIIEEVGRKTSHERIVECKTVWEQMQSKFRVEDVHFDPIVSIIANDECVEFILRYIVEDEQRKLTKVKLFTKILKEIKITNGEIKFAPTIFSMKMSY